VPQATTRICPLWILRVRAYERRDRTIRQQPFQGNISNSHVCSSDIKGANYKYMMFINFFLQDFKEPKATRINERTLYNIVEDLCLFLLKQVISMEGKYHDHESELSKPEFRVLTEIYRLNLTRKGY